MKTIDNLINFEKTDEILSLVEDNEIDIKDQLNRELKENNIFYKNDIYPLCINPIILSNEILNISNNISNNFNLLMKDSASLLKNNEELSRKILGGHPLYTLLEKNLSLMDVEEIDKIYYRLDGIIHNNEFKMIEANMNSPGGIFTLEKMHGISSSIYSNLLNENFNFPNGSDKLLEHFINTYNDRYSNNELFIVSGNKNDEERFEHRLISKKLRENGIPARTLDYRDRKIKLNCENLLYCDQKIGVLYRRSFPIEFNQDIIESGKTTVLNPPASKLLASKSMFALFHELKDSELSSHKEFIERNIAYTSFLSEIDKKELISNKDLYVLKEISLNCGNGIYIGKAESYEEWKNIVNNSSPRNVVQKYYEQPEMKFIDNKISGSRSRKFDFSLYAIGKETIMPYIRVNSEGSYKSNNACGSSEGLCFIGEKK